MHNTAIKVEKLTKSFGNFIAVDNISFSVAEGEIFGFLGPNGAGKTTTIRMLCGLIDPTSGYGDVYSFNIHKEAEELKHHIGYMSQKFSLYDDLTVSENIDFYLGIYQTGKESRKKKKEETIARAELFGKENVLTRDLATSLKQHLALGCTMVHDPKVIFLDEPTAGVDPLSRKNFWSIIKQLAQAGTSILVTTHYMDEAEHCDRIALINSGKIIACDTPFNLKTKYMKNAIFEIECDNVMAGLEALRHNPAIIDVTLYGLFLHVVLPDENIIDSISNILAEKSITVTRAEKITPSLEDVFVFLVEEQTRRNKT